VTVPNGDNSALAALSPAAITSTSQLLHYEQRTRVRRSMSRISASRRRASPAGSSSMQLWHQTIRPQVGFRGVAQRDWRAGFGFHL